jgi:hypothetical protein
MCCYRITCSRAGRRLAAERRGREETPHQQTGGKAASTAAVGHKANTNSADGANIKAKTKTKTKTKAEAPSSAAATEPFQANTRAGAIGV